MLTKQLSRNFRIIPDKELIEVDGGKIDIRETLLNFVSFIDIIRDIEEERKNRENNNIPFYHLLRDKLIF